MLEISVDLLLMSGFVFLAVLFLLNQILYKPLLGFMNERDDSIRKDLDNVGKNNTSIHEIVAQSAKVVSEAKAEAHIIREKALNEANTLFESKIHQKKEQLDKAYSEYLVSLEKSKVELHTKLMGNKDMFRLTLKNKIAQA